MDISSDIEKMLNAINTLSPKESESYKKYLAYCERIYNLTADIFLFTPIHEVRKIMEKGNTMQMLACAQLMQENDMPTSDQLRKGSVDTVKLLK